MTIKALIFDIGGVQLFYDHWKAAKPMSKLLGLPAKEIYKVIADKGSHPGFTELCETKASEREYWQYAAKKWKIDFKDFPTKKMDSLWNKIFYPNKVILDTLPKLKRKYKLGLLSNMGRGHIKYLKKTYKISKLFRASVFSGLVGMRKPNPNIYKLMLKKLKVGPEEALFIDDRKLNIVAAKKLRINTIHFKNNKQFFKEIKKYKK